MRIIGGFLIYIGLFFGPSGTLANTPLVQSIRTIYPTWYFVFTDIALTVFAIASITACIYMLLFLAKRKHGSKTLQKRLQKLDKTLIQLLLTLLSSLTRWCIGFIIAILVVLILSPFIYVPIYFVQPVLYILIVLGITLLIESFSFWQKKINSFFCI